jgi:diamine N-acetyltransferase
MQWRLRRAAEADAPTLSLLAAATFLETFAGVLSGPDIVAHCARKSSPEAFGEWLHGDGVATLAEHPTGGAPVGYTLLTPPDFPVPTGPGDLELRRIYTLDLARGTGLGRMLMERALADAGEAGATRLLLGVKTTNSRARAFYEREGFAMAGERRFLVGDTWHDDVIYARPL